MEAEKMKRKRTGLKIGIIGFGVVGSAAAHRLYELGNEIYVNDVRKPQQLENWDENFIFREEYDINETDATFIALPTPSTEEELYVNLSVDKRNHTIEGRFGETLDKTIFYKVVDQLGQALKKSKRYHLFVVRSTVEPGTTRSTGRRLEELSGKRLHTDFGLGMIPEFLRAFNNIQDEKLAKKIIFGHLDERSLQLMKKIYQNAETEDNSKLFPMTLEEAELVKMESNAINALWISIQNSRGEFYELLAERLGMDIDYGRMTEVLTKMTEAYYNPTYGTSAGIFFGGTCLKKDPNALHAWAEDQNRVYSHFTRFIEEALRVNQGLQKRILNDHLLPKTITNGLPKRILERDHPTYENIRKIKVAQEEIDQQKGSALSSGFNMSAAMYAAMPAVIKTASLPAKISKISNGKKKNSQLATKIEIRSIP